MAKRPIGPRVPTRATVRQSGRGTRGRVLLLQLRNVTFGSTSFTVLLMHVVFFLGGFGRFGFGLPGRQAQGRHTRVTQQLSLVSEYVSTHGSRTTTRSVSNLLYPPPYALPLPPTRALTAAGHHSPACHQQQPQWAPPPSHTSHISAHTRHRSRTHLNGRARRRIGFRASFGLPTSAPSLNRCASGETSRLLS